MRKSDQKKIEDIKKKWRDFLRCREGNFLTVDERERMVSELLSIYERYRKKIEIYDLSS